MSLVLVLGLLTQTAWYHVLRMPGQSFAGVPDALGRSDASLRNTLKRDVEYLAKRLGTRHVGMPTNLNKSRDYIKAQLTRAKTTVTLQDFQVQEITCSNVIGERLGKAEPERIIIFGAHYDSLPDQVGADDNASGVALLLALARTTANREYDYTLRFVAFANEESPHFGTDAMGSLQYARACRARNEEIVGMFSLDGVGYFTDEPRTQAYPACLGLIYPRTGNFVAMITRFEDGSLLRRTIAAFRDRTQTQLASVGAVLPAKFSRVSWSDHWAFWECGYPALLVTDTLPFRNPHYHTPADTPDTLNYDAMTQLVRGLVTVIDHLATASRQTLGERDD